MASSERVAEDTCLMTYAPEQAALGKLCLHTSSDLHLLFCLSHSHQLKPVSPHGPLWAERRDRPLVSPHPWEAA